MRAAGATVGPVKAGRNDPCHCGSGKKFKTCCMGKGVAEAKAPAAPATDKLRPRLNALFREAEKLCNQGRWADALPIIEEIARLDPTSPQALHDLGVAYFQCGRLPQSLAPLQRAVALRPS